MSLFRNQRREAGRAFVRSARRLRDALAGVPKLPAASNLPERILIIRPFFLGDILLSLPLAQEIKRRRPGAQVTWLLREEWKELLLNHSVVDEVIGFSQARMHSVRAPSEFFRITQELRQRRFDLAISLSWDRSSTMWTWASGAPIRIGIEEFGRPRLLSLLYHSTVVAPERSRDSQHMADFYYEPLRLLGAEARSECPTLFATPEENETVDLRLESFCEENFPLILIHPGSRLSQKRWPLPHFAELIQALSVETHYRIVLTCGPGEEALVADLASNLPEGRGSFWPAPSIGEFVALAKRSTLFIGNDSGPMHMAAAAGCSVLALFGSDSTRWRPIGPRSHVLEAKGITNLPLSEVVNKAREIMAAIKL